MLDPRIYRTGLMVVVLGFSFESQQGPLPASLAPEAFNGGNVHATMKKLAGDYPYRSPGSPSDRDIAVQVSSSLSQYGFTPTTTTFATRTADGEQTLENVIGVRPGV